MSATFNVGAGYKVVPLTTPYTVPVSGGYYVAFLQYGAGATGATLMFGASNAQGAQIGTAARISAQQANLTDLNANATFADSTNSFWFAVN